MGLLEARHRVTVREQGHQGASAPGSEQEAGDAAGSGEQQAFGEELADHTQAAGAQGGADGNFAGAIGSARQQQVGDVQACDEQHESNGAERNQQAGANPIGELPGHRNQAYAPALAYVFGRDFLEDGKQVRLRLLGRDSGTQTDCCGGAVLAFCGVGGSELPWCPECEALVVKEVFGHDSDDGVGGCVEEEGLAQDAAVARKAALPELMGEDHDAGRARAKLLIAEDAAERRGAGEHAETVARHFAAVLVSRTLGTGEGHVLPVRQADLLEGLHAPAKDLGVGGRDAGGLALGIDLVETVKTIGITVGQGAQENGIHHAEDRAVGADAEGQNGDHNGDEARGAA